MMSVMFRISPPHAWHTSGVNLINRLDELGLGARAVAVAERVAGSAAAEVTVGIETWRAQV